MTGPSAGEMMRKKHKRSWAGGDDYSCDHCDQGESAWPCDAIVVLDALKAAETERDDYLAKLKHCLTAGETTARLLDQAETERDRQADYTKRIVEMWHWTRKNLELAETERDAARAEVVRLREALERLANPDPFEFSNVPAAMVPLLCEAARVALEPPQ